MSNISSSTLVIIVGLIALILFAIKKRNVVSSHRELLNIVCFVLVVIMIIFAVYTVFF